ncbi:pseudouridine synthase [Burkholderia ubonensis]|uniref:pseudouridine synthase n=1 Tax=Burkholderia ubonensis TaxID=101571 RepID=UPI000F55C3A8|nr:pseudouridine synthase [Burkholderia ubonensis]RQP37067.1 pseudouridine synthase [Burkholderia ubonensis]RQP43406.1 pseudouridine synthase [Burkholderia ubonensis]RQP46190.1 pseudouridine synthase [Burkholderia ubonensis]RQP59521.1 pseudouridine synthase [Burkholderia ubonensis]RQP65582.1 pseudouridine synthase [Burkholderia ubonensis]
MRTKLTVKNPRPASPTRAPVRSGSLVARKPVRAAAPDAAAKPARPKKAPAPAAAGERAFKPRAAGGADRPGADRAPAKRPPRDGGAERSYRGGDAKPTGRTEQRGAGRTGESRPYRSAEGKPGARGERGESRPYRDKDAKPAGRTERGERRPGEDRPYRNAEGKPAARGERGESRPYRGTDAKPAGRTERGERGESRYRDKDAKFAGRAERGEGRPYRSADGKPGARGERSDTRPYRSTDANPARERRSTDGKFSRGKPDARPARRGDDDARPRRASAGAEGGKRPYRDTAGGEGAKRSFGERRTSSDRPARAPRDGDRAARGPNAPAKRGAAERPSSGAGFKTAQPVKRRAADVDRGDESGLMRLSKRMSELGLCSRREADEWIEKGWVLVDGERIDTLGTKVRADQRIEIDERASAAQAAQVTILLHKPVGYVSGQAEDGYEPATVLITRENHWSGDRSALRFSPQHLHSLAPAGRLDIDSTGLLVLTQNGRIAKQLIGEQSDIDKEYLVRVRFGERLIDIDQHFPAESLAKLRHGLELDGVALKPAMVSWQNGEQLRFVLREGKKRQIRRMCELVGLEVVGLKRVRMGRVMLGALPQGQWRYLSADETF